MCVDKTLVRMQHRDASARSTKLRRDLPAPGQNAPLVADLLANVEAAVGRAALVVTAVSRERGAVEACVTAAVGVVNAAS